MSMNIADAEEAWAGAETKVQEFSADFLARWYEPMIRLQFALVMATMPPEIKDQLKAMYPDLEDVIGG